jgi:hypothetical protein
LSINIYNTQGYLLSQCYSLPRQIIWIPKRTQSKSDNQTRRNLIIVEILLCCGWRQQFHISDEARISPTDSRNVQIAHWNRCYEYWLSILFYAQRVNQMFLREKCKNHKNHSFFLALWHDDVMPEFFKCDSKYILMNCYATKPFCVLLYLTITCAQSGSNTRKKYILLLN